jgi:hypothetical protein
MALLSEDGLTFYLPFPDGVLHYVCAECDALCCRGAGLAGSLAREMGQLLVLYPALAGAVISRRGDVITLQNPSRACFFLRDDNRCDIEVTHGPQLKPGLCRLFPFSNFARLGDGVVVIAPHFMCPLRLILPRADRAAGRHHDIIQAAKESFLLDRADFAVSFVSLALPPGRTAGDVLEQETRFRDGCSDDLQAGRFFATLSRSSANPDALKRFLDRAARVCGVSPAAARDRDDLDDFLRVLAPYWRLKMLPLGHERMLKALALADVLIRRLAALSPRPITLQQADQFYEQMSPVGRLLSRDELPLALPDGAPQLPPFGTSELTFTAYQALRAAGTGVMAAFEQAFAAGTPTHDRMAILNDLGRYYGDAAPAAAPPA